MLVKTQELINPAPSVPVRLAAEDFAGGRSAWLVAVLAADRQNHRINPEKTAIFPTTLGKIERYLSRGTDAGIGEE